MLSRNDGRMGKRWEVELPPARIAFDGRRTDKSCLLIRTNLAPKDWYFRAKTRVKNVVRARQKQCFTWNMHGRGSIPNFCVIFFPFFLHAARTYIMALVQMKTFPFWKSHPAFERLRLVHGCASSMPFWRILAQLGHKGVHSIRFQTPSDELCRYLAEFIPTVDTVHRIWVYCFSCLRNNDCVRN